MRLTLSVIFFCGIIASCKSIQYSSNALPKNRIEIGEGGGFTGNYTTYVILPNRQVFVKFDFETEYRSAPEIDKKSYRKIKNEVKRLNIPRNDTIIVGNMNRFIRVFERDTFYELYWSFESEMIQFDSSHHPVSYPLQQSDSTTTSFL